MYTTSAGRQQLQARDIKYVQLDEDIHLEQLA